MEDKGKNVKVFMLHGLGGAPNGGWRPWLMAELAKQGAYACSLSMPDPENPRLDEWLGEASRHVERNAGDDLYLVGHSLGALTVLRYLETAPRKVAGAILVSGPCESNGNPKVDAFLKTSVDFAKIKPNAESFVVIHGEDDDVVPLGHAKKISAGLSCELMVVPEGGHLNGSDGWRTLPQALEALGKMLQ